MFVAINTGQLMVFGLISLQLFGHLSMAGTTVNIGDILTISDHQRTVGRMTGQTVLHLLPLSVGLVTIETVGNLPVDRMALGTSQLGMLTDMGLKLLTLGSVAGETGLGNVPGEGDGQGSMGIRVTTQAILQGVMGFTLVALRTLWNDLFLRFHRGMALMAIHTGNLGLVLGPVLDVLVDHPWVTFHTVRIAQLIPRPTR